MTRSPTFLILILIVILIPSPLRAQAQSLPLSKDSPTLLLFLRADQPQSLDELTQLQPLLKDHPNLKILPILSGDDAQSAATTLAPKCPWPIFTDPTYATSGKFEVHVWPTTVLLPPTNAAGAAGASKPIAHIPGLPISYTADLSAYLDFATNRIDKDTLDKRLANRDLVVDTSDQKAARHIEVANRLVTQGMKEEAKIELTKAISLNPTDPTLLLTIARIHLTLNNPASADKILNTPALQTNSPIQLNTLKAWAALQQNNYPLARQLLEQSLPLNPDPAEADYLYALVLQHDNDPTKAATYFRHAFEHTDLGKQFTQTP